MHYIDTIENTLFIDTFKFAIRQIVNMCYGNLTTISRTRLNNIKQNRDPNYIATIDTPAGEASDEFTQAARMEEIGHAPGLTLTQRGDCYASISAYCMNIAIGRGWDGYDKPQSFREHLEGRITRLRARVPTKAEIREEMQATRGITEEEAKEFLFESFKEQAKMLEDDLEAIVAEEGHYETTIDVEEAIASLRLMDQQRMRVKVLDGIMYEVDRLHDQRKRFPKFRDLQTKREIFLDDAIRLEKELNEFEKANRDKLIKESNEGQGTPQATIRDEHARRLELYKRALKEEHEDTKLQKVA